MLDGPQTVPGVIASRTAHAVAGERERTLDARERTLIASASALTTAGQSGVGRRLSTSSRMLDGSTLAGSVSRRLPRNTAPATAWEKIDNQHHVSGRVENTVAHQADSCASETDEEKRASP